MSDIPFDVLLREKLAHIDLMLMQHTLTQAQHDRTRQELRLAPWALVLTGVTSGAALFAAAFAFARLFQ
jgi:hypothetical protein